MRKIFARESRSSSHGKQYQMPYPGGTGLGKPLKSTMHPLRTDMPIYLAAEGPKNVALAAEIADGWLPIFFSPKSDEFYRDALAEGFARPGARRTPDDFEVACVVPIILNDDVEAAADIDAPDARAVHRRHGRARRRTSTTTCSRGMGYEDECAKIQELYLEGKKREAMAAVPTKLVEDVALIGPIGKIKDDLPAWKKTCLTTMLVGGPPHAPRDDREGGAMTTQPCTDEATS